MAGSFGHVAPPGGKWSLVENMGDAHETVEQLLWLVLRVVGPEKANGLLKEEFYRMKRREIAKDEALVAVESIMDA